MTRINIGCNTAGDGDPLSAPCLIYIVFVNKYFNGVPTGKCYCGDILSRLSSIVLHSMAKIDNEIMHPEKQELQKTNNINNKIDNNSKAFIDRRAALNSDQC